MHTRVDASQVKRKQRPVPHCHQNGCGRHQRGSHIHIDGTWSLRKDQLSKMDAIVDKYGSIGASPYAVDIVSMALETRHGVWMAEVPIKPKGISKKKRTIGMPEFRHFTEFAGRFVNLLPAKDGATTLH